MLLEFTSSDDDDRGDRKKAHTRAIIPAIVIWALNFVIVMSASNAQFDMIGLGDRYEYHTVVMWIALSTSVACLVCSVCACAAIASENQMCALVTALMTAVIGLGSIAAFMVMYVYIGNMWGTDPRHTLFFYGTFWSEGVTQPAIDIAVAHNISKIPFDRAALAPMWVYTMSDVLVRIAAFSLMLLPVMLAVVFVCGGLAMGYDRVLDNQFVALRD